MIVDLDETLAAIENRLEPWDLKLRIGGVEYDTRPPSLADLAILSNKSADPAGHLETFLSLFRDEKPPLEQLAGDRMIACAAVIMTYFQQRSEKNSRAIAAQARAAIAGSSTSGKS